MASLVEDLVTVLNEEEQLYRRFIEYGEKKRQILIDSDVPALEQLTSLEQMTSDELLSLSNRQIQILKDIATVIGKTGEKLTVTKLVGYLGSQPDIQTKLQEARDGLLDAAGQVQELNRTNEALLKQAMELTEFNITLFRSMRQAPETANYDKNAYNTGTLLGSSGFDAKQ